MAASKSALLRTSYGIFRSPQAVVGYRTSSLSCRNVAHSVSRTLPLSNRLLSFSSNLQGSRTLHHHCGNRYTYTTHRRTWTARPARWYSSTGSGASGGGGGGASRGGGAGGGGKGFFQNFFDNLKKGVEKNQEIQESLKGFHEEREKLHQSYVMQQVKLKFAAAVEKIGALGQKGAEGWRVVKDTSSKVLYLYLYPRTDAIQFVLNVCDSASAVWQC